jgi:hypothetical protein
MFSRSMMRLRRFNGHEVSDLDRLKRLVKGNTTPVLRFEFDDPVSIMAFLVSARKQLLAT